MKNSIFEYKDYKEYLTDIITLRSKTSRGERSRLARALDCQPAFISQVLNGYAHFSLEQGEKTNKYLGHNKVQSVFFVLLIQYSRSGLPSLKSIFEEQMNDIIEKQFVLKNRLEFKKALSREDQATFYSSWIYGAVHVLVSVPGCHTDRGISDYLNVPIQRINSVLEFLTSVGLVIKDGATYKIGTTHIHLEGDSPMISKHHTNWRVQAIQSFDRNDTKDLHYSSVITASQEDAKKVKEILVKAIEKIRSIVRESKDEDGFCYLLDFFQLKHK